MKYKSFSMLLVVLLAVLTFTYASANRMSANRGCSVGGDENQAAQDWPEQERIDRTYRLDAAARVEVSTIYGPVDIETSDTDTAEIHVIRYARSREDLTSRKISVDLTPSVVAIRGEKDQSEEPLKVRHRVLLKLPRSVQLSAESVNGHLNVGEIEGAIHIHRINGAVRVARGGGAAEISRVNGSFNLTLTRLVQSGLKLQSVNGTVELRFLTEIDADVTIAEFNGAVNITLPNTSILQKTERQTFRACIGSGGVPISISDVNGSVILAPAS
jgi:DUF4097 and DUF4098 domain-containing protein YvlB